MWLCTEWKIDWDAVAAVATAAAAIIALIIWSFDKVQRRRERAASAKLLAQIMTTPFGAAQVEIAKFRCVVRPLNGDQTYLAALKNDENVRQDLANKATKVRLDLPSQFLDKADIFTEKVNNRLANAFAQVNRLEKICSLLGDLPNSASETDITMHINSVLTQIKETEEATKEAFQALLEAGKSS
ncbi:MULTISPECIES: hypothetical protein [Pseudomonas]|uniref:hypothetical protein n=1 Tax=Pseudomonas TaxID=286 RepID=UPI00387AF75B